MSTAIIGDYGKGGFVIASDGLGTDKRGPDRNNENAQKIFSIRREHCVLACSIMGNPFIVEDAGGAEVVDFAKEITARSVLISDDLENLADFVKEVCVPINSILREARKAERIWDFPSGAVLIGEQGDTILRAEFMGYFKGEPSYVSVRFFHVGQVLGEPDILSIDPRQGYHFGSVAISDLVRRRDPRFEKYGVPATELFTFDGRITAARGYIDAYGDPEARRIDPKCSAIGGKTQVCTITKEKGFEWVKGCGPDTIIP